MQQQSRHCLLGICQTAGPLGRVRLMSTDCLADEGQVYQMAAPVPALKIERDARRDFVQQVPSCPLEEVTDKAAKKDFRDLTNCDRQAVPKGFVVIVTMQLPIVGPNGGPVMEEDACSRACIVAAMRLKDVSEEDGQIVETLRRAGLIHCERFDCI